MACRGSLLRTKKTSSWPAWIKAASVLFELEPLPRSRGHCRQWDPPEWGQCGSFLAGIQHGDFRPYRNWFMSTDISMLHSPWLSWVQLQVHLSSSCLKGLCKVDCAARWNAGVCSAVDEQPQAQNHAKEAGEEERESERKREREQGACLPSSNFDAIAHRETMTSLQRRSGKSQAGNVTKPTYPTYPAIQRTHTETIARTTRNNNWL